MMRNIAFIILVALSPAGTPSCDEILRVINTETQSGSQISGQEVIEGLKTALLVGTDSSVSSTSRINGYFKDEAIKILLPPEANIIYENKDHMLFRAVGLDKKIDETILAINRAAEDAASEAGPIFRSSIRSLSITDGITILKGSNPAAANQSQAFDSTAATEYLKSTTYPQLINAFSPKIKTSLDKKLVGNYSPNQLWENLTGSYNSIAERSMGMVTPLENTDLSAYVTEKAMEGLFYKVAIEEKKIRKDPWKWAQTSVGNILQKVFG